MNARRSTWPLAFLLAAAGCRSTATKEGGRTSPARDPEAPARSASIAPELSTGLPPGFAPVLLPAPVAVASTGEGAPVGASSPIELGPSPADVNRASAGPVKAGILLPEVLNPAIFVPRLIFPLSGGVSEAPTLAPTLEWTAAGSDGVLYDVEIRPESGAGPPAAPPAPRYSLGVRGERLRAGEFRAGRSYRVRVRAVMGGEERSPGAWSEEGLLRIPRHPPDEVEVSILEHLAFTEAPAASPDGKMVAYLARHGSAPPEGLYQDHVGRVVRGPGGKIVLYELAFRGIYQSFFRRPIGPPSWVPQEGEEGEREWILAYALAVRGGSETLLALENPLHPARAALTPGLRVRLGRISSPWKGSAPSGGRIYFEAPGGEEIWSARPDGGEPVLEAMGTNPQVSPDGRHLLYLSEEDGAPNLWLLRLGGPGAGARRPLLRGIHPGNKVDGYAWSPRMDQVAISADLSPDAGHAGNLDISILEIASGELRPITRHLSDDRDPVFLPAALEEEGEGSGGTSGAPPDGIIFTSQRMEAGYEGYRGLYFADLRRR